MDVLGNAHGAPQAMLMGRRQVSKPRSLASTPKFFRRTSRKQLRMDQIYAVVKLLV